MKFIDLVEVNPKIPIKRGLEYPCIMMDEVEPGRKFVKGKIIKPFKGGSKFEKGDTLFARITPCLENKKIAKYNGENGNYGFGSTEFFIFRAKPNISDPDYIYYLSLSDLITSPAIASMVGASGRQRANLSVIENLDIPFHSLVNQQKIASVLSNYDNLIENNTRRIEILEEMAQRIYKEWFVDFKYPGYENDELVDSELGMVPEGWEIHELGSSINFQRGKNLTKKQMVEGNIPVVSAGINPSGYHNTYNVTGPVVTVSASGANAGYISLYLRDVWASDCSFFNHESSDYFFYFYCLINSRKKEVNNMQRGSAQPHVYPKDLMSLFITNPPKNLIEKFEEISKTIFYQIGSLRKKNITLTQTRDYLLPKLISGKVDVSDLDIDISILDD